MQILQGADIWRAAKCVKSQTARILEALKTREGKQANTTIEKEEMLRLEAFHPNDDDQYYELPPASSVPTKVSKNAVQWTLHSDSVKRTPAPDKVTVGVICLLGKSDEERIVGLPTAVVFTVLYPALWIGASGVVILKPGKANCTKQKVYHSMSLLGSMGQVVVQVVMELLSHDAKQWELLRDGQCCNRIRWSVIGAAAMMVNRAQATWMDGHITGEHLMDIMPESPSIEKQRLVNEMKTMNIDADHI